MSHYYSAVVQLRLPHVARSGAGYRAMQRTADDPLPKASFTFTDDLGQTWALQKGCTRPSDTGVKRWGSCTVEPGGIRGRGL